MIAIQERERESFNNMSGYFKLSYNRNIVFSIGNVVSHLAFLFILPHLFRTIFRMKIVVISFRRARGPGDAITHVISLYCFTAIDAWDAIGMAEISIVKE